MIRVYNVISKVKRRLVTWTFIAFFYSSNFVSKLGLDLVHERSDSCYVICESSQKLQPSKI